MKRRIVIPTHVRDLPADALVPQADRDEPEGARVSFIILIFEGTDKQYEYYSFEFLVNVTCSPKTRCDTCHPAFSHAFAWECLLLLFSHH